MEMSVASRSGRVVGGILVTLVALWAMHGAIQATRGERLYQRVKFGSLKLADVPQRAQVLEQAFALRPTHYNLCTLAAEMQWHDRLHPQRGSSALARCQVWTQRGLSLNTRMPQLRIQHARLLAESDPLAAATYWADYVDDHYWNPYNQAVLCDFYARAGRIEQAASVLARIRGMGHHAWASQQLQHAVAREMALSPFAQER
jgi:hypothetical protein